MSETPIYDELAQKYGFVEKKLTDSQIEGRDEVVAEDRIDIYKVDTPNPQAFEVAEINHEVIQPPSYEMKTLSHTEQLQETINNLSEHMLVGDVAGVSHALDAVRQLTIAA